MFDYQRVSNTTQYIYIFILHIYVCVYICISIYIHIDCESCSFPTSVLGYFHLLHHAMHVQVTKGAVSCRHVAQEAIGFSGREAGGKSLDAIELALAVDGR